MSEVIQILNQSGLEVIEIFHPDNRKETLRYYMLTNFIPSQQNINEHTILGKDITDIVMKDSLSVHQIDNISRERTIATKISTIEDVQKKFSKDFSFIWHFASK